MLVDLEDYSYEQFKKDYKEMEKDKRLNSLELYNHFINMHPKI